MSQQCIASSTSTIECLEFLGTTFHQYHLFFESGSTNESTQSRGRSTARANKTRPCATTKSREYECGHYTQTVTRLCARQHRTAETCPDYHPYQEPELEVIPSCCTNECCRQLEAPYFDAITAHETTLANWRRRPDRYGPHMIRDKQDDIRRARRAAERVQARHDRCRRYRDWLYGDPEPYGP